MSDENMMLTLGKVIIAVAWADGEVTHDEINTLKELLGRLPNLTARQWASLDMYIDSPVEDAERARLVEDLRARISSDSDKQLVYQALRDLVAADGKVTEDEERVVAEIKAAVESVEVGAVGGFLQLVKGMVGRRPQAVSDAPNREDFFEDFVKNKVYYSVSRRLDLGDEELNIPDDTLRKLSLAGGLMARIARADQKVTEDEFATMVETLQSGWNISLEEATLVAEVAMSEAAANLNNFHLANEFTKSCTTDELTRFLDILFAIAAADGEASKDEIEEIRAMAAAFNLPNKYFIGAKLKIPRDQRQQ